MSVVMQRLPYPTEIWDSYPIRSLEIDSPIIHRQSQKTIKTVTSCRLEKWVIRNSRAFCGLDCGLWLINHAKWWVLQSVDILERDLSEKDISTGCPICPCTWVGLNLNWIFHHLAQLLSRFCQIPVGPNRISQMFEHSKSNSTQPRCITL